MYVNHSRAHQAVSRVTLNIYRITRETKHTLGKKPYSCESAGFYD